jgi:general secretion pathway protein D
LGIADLNDQVRKQAEKAASGKRDAEKIRMRNSLLTHDDHQKRPLVLHFQAAALAFRMFSAGTVRYALRNVLLTICLVLGSIGTGAAQERVTLNFVNADLDAVVRAIGHFTGRTFVIDPRVKGTLNLVSEKPMSRCRALAALSGALRLQGFAIVEVGGISRVVPEADAKFQGGPVDVSNVPQSVRGDQVITHVFRLRYVSATNVLPVVRPLVPPNNPVIAYARSNALVVTDYADNLRRIEKIINAIDVETRAGTEVISLDHAIASDLALLVARLTDPQGNGGAALDPNERIIVLADPVTNSVILKSRSPSQISAAKRIVDELDQPGPAGAGVYVVSLRNAEAESLAEVLTQIPTGGEGVVQSGGRPGGPGSPATVQVGQDRATVVADAASNSLIISATQSAYRQLRAVIDRLDERKAQVFIESLLVEVQMDQAAEFGIQWLGGLDDVAGSSTALVGGTNFGDASQNIVSGAQNIGNLGKGLNVGVISGQVTIPGLGAITNLNFLARALEAQTDANILSTPNILTLDNEEATIVVAENVPFVTGSYANTGTAAPGVNPFQTIERQDVGLILKVKPQISEGGTIRMSIYEEASAVKEGTASNGGIVTTKRSIETDVLIDDGSIIVLGGLVQDQIATVVERVPILGSLPVLGHLFRYETRLKKKTNLMLFLRPFVIRNKDDSRSLTVERYDMMRRLEKSVAPGPHFALPTYENPRLPEIDFGSEVDLTPADPPPASATKPAQ